jgi:hypothetical protein
VLDKIISCCDPLSPVLCTFKSVCDAAVLALAIVTGSRNLLCPSICNSSAVESYFKLGRPAPEPNIKAVSSPICVVTVITFLLIFHLF